MIPAGKLRVGFIPLVDSATLLIAADKGFAAEEGLFLELTREVSWANIREKLNARIFDAAHMLTPMAIASAIGVGQASEPLIAPFTLAFNGNAITVNQALYDELAAELGGADHDPLETARALNRVVRKRRREKRGPLTFGMTFPFSSHNYQLRLWMAAGGIAPDEDVRLIVLPPPYMVESMATGDVDGFCVGAPWNSLAADLGVGRILHFGSEIVAKLAEKVLAVRTKWAGRNHDTLIRLIRALSASGEFLASPENWRECARLLSAPDRIGVKAEFIYRTLSGELRIAPDGTTRIDSSYLMIGNGLSARPDPVQGAWLYAQMVRWGQATLDRDALQSACDVLSPKIFDEALGSIPASKSEKVPADGIGALGGPFESQNIEGYLAAF